MPDPTFPPAEELLERVHTTGSSTGEAAFTSSSGRTIWQVGGWTGENRLRVEGATLAEAWSRAVEAAAGVGMLAHWPKPRE
jgi:hypothetical protein